MIQSIRMLLILSVIWGWLSMYLCWGWFIISVDMKCFIMSVVNSTTYWGFAAFSLSHSATVYWRCILHLLWKSSLTCCNFLSNLSDFFFSFSFLIFSRSSLLFLASFTPEVVLLEFWLFVLTLIGKLDPFLRLSPVAGAVLGCWDPYIIGGICCCCYCYLVRCKLLMYLFTELPFSCWDDGFSLNLSDESFVFPLFVWDLSMLEFYFPG